MATAVAEGSEETPRQRARALLPERLPHLEGRRGAAVRGLYVVVALATLIVVCGSFWFNGRDYFGNMRIAGAYGFRTQTVTGGVAIAGAQSEEARASGMRAGDALVAVNGRPLAAGATEFEVAEMLSADRDGRLTLVTRSGDGETRTHSLTRRPVAWQTREPATQLPLLVFIAVGFASTQLPLVALFAASVLLARRRPRDPEAMLFAFGFLLLCVNAGSAFWIIVYGGIPNLVFEEISNIGACMMLAAIAGFPDGRYKNLWSRLTLLLILLVAVLVVAAPTGWSGMSAFFLAATLAVVPSVAIRYRREASGIERQQIKWAVLGFGASLAIIVPVQIVGAFDLVQGPRAEAIEFLLDRVALGVAVMLIPAGLLVSLLRYRLYDAESAMSRSAGYAVLTLMLGAVFAASAEGIEWFFETSLGREAGALPGAIGAALAVVLITPLNSRVQGWAERRFQKGLMRLRRDLPDCVGDLRETSSTGPLVEEVLERVSAGVRPRQAAVLIGADVAATRDVQAAEVKEWAAAARLDGIAAELDCDRSDPLFPMRVPLKVRHGETAPIGWILLGPRPDGSFYGQDEREALAEVADPIARAVRIVSLREERERRHEARLSELEAAVAKLSKKRE